MTSLDRLRTRIHEVVHERLYHLGFEFDAQSQMHLRDSSRDVQHRVLLLFDIPAMSGTVVCTAIMVVQCTAREALALKAGVSGPINRHASVVRNVGHLMPTRRWRYWNFLVEDDCSARIDDLAGAIITYGTPWLNSINRNETFVRVWKTHRPLAQPRTRLLLEESRASKYKTDDRALRRAFSRASG